MAKTEKKIYTCIYICKRSSPEIQAFFWTIGGEDHKKRFSPGDENHFGGLLLHILSIIEKKKVAGRMAIKGRGPGKMSWRAVGCRPLP